MGWWDGCGRGRYVGSLWEYAAIIWKRTYCYSLGIRLPIVIQINLIEDVASIRMVHAIEDLSIQQPFLVMTCTDNGLSITCKK